MINVNTKVGGLKTEFILIVFLLLVSCSSKFDYQDHLDLMQGKEDEIYKSFRGVSIKQNEGRNTIPFFSLRVQGNLFSIPNFSLTPDSVFLSSPRYRDKLEGSALCELFPVQENEVSCVKSFSSYTISSFKKLKTARVFSPSYESNFISILCADGNTLLMLHHGSIDSLKNNYWREAFYKSKRLSDVWYLVEL